MNKSGHEGSIQSSQNLITTMSAPVVVLDRNNIICDVNDVFLSELKYERSEIVNKINITEISISATDKRLGMLNPSKFLNRSGKGWYNFIVIKEKGGKLRYFFYTKANTSNNCRVFFLFDHSHSVEIMSEPEHKSASFRELISAFPGIIIIFNNKMKINEINVSRDIDVSLIFNLRKGNTLTQSNLPESVKVLCLQNLKKSISEKKDITFEYSLEIYNQVRYFLAKLVYRNNYIVALISEVTEDKTALLELSNKSRDLTRMLDDMPVAVVQVNINGKIAFANSSFNDLISRSGVSSSYCISSYLGEKLFSELKSNGKGNRKHCIQLGKLFIDVINRKRIVNKETFHIILFIDVTEREKSKMALEKSETKHKMMVDNMPNGIIIRDEHQIFYANQEALKILGFKNLKDIDLSKVLSDEDLQSIRSRQVETCEGKDVGFMDYTLIPADSKTPVVITTKPILVDYQGKQAFQIVFRNSSAEKLLMDEKVKKQVLQGHNKKLTIEIARRVEIENKLKKTIDENKILLNEVHHRVKNNHQIISSMLNHCLTNISDPASIKAITSVKNRLVSMAVVNDFYLDADNYNSILLYNYLKKIQHNFIREHGSESMISNIKYQADVRHLVVDLNDAVPIGLIFNEILTVLYQLVDKLSDKFCNFVLLKWLHKNTIMITVSFDKEIFSKIGTHIENSNELNSLRDLMEQVSGEIKCLFDKAELQLIVKLSKID